MATYTQQMRETKRNDIDRFMSFVGRFSIHLALIIFSLACLIPLLLIVSASFTDEGALTRQGYGLLPAQFSTQAYELILRQPDAIIRAYGVTIFTTLVGTVIAVTLMSLLAYPLSRPDFALRRPLSFFVFFTMLFNGGIVPYYLLMTQFLRVQDTIMALLLPHFVGVFYVPYPPHVFRGACPVNYSMPHESMARANGESSSQLSCRSPNRLWQRLACSSPSTTGMIGQRRCISSAIPTCTLCNICFISSRVMPMP